MRAHEEATVELMRENEALKSALRPFARFGQVVKHLEGPSSPGDMEAESHIAGKAQLSKADFALAERISFGSI